MLVESQLSRNIVGELTTAELTYAIFLCWRLRVFPLQSSDRQVSFSIITMLTNRGAALGEQDVLFMFHSPRSMVAKHTDKALQFTTKVCYWE